MSKMIKINNQIIDCKIVRTKYFEKGKCNILDCPYKLNKQNNNVLIAHLANKHRDIYSIEEIELRKEFQLCRTRLRQRTTKSKDQKEWDDRQSDSKIISYMAYLRLKAVKPINQLNFSSNVLINTKESTSIKSNESSDHDSSGYYSTDSSLNELRLIKRSKKDCKLMITDEPEIIDLSDNEKISKNNIKSSDLIASIESKIDEEIQIVFDESNEENIKVDVYDDIEIVFESIH